MAKVLGLKQLLQRSYTYLDGISEAMRASFGSLTDNFIMIVWGQSGNGKSNFMMQLLRELMPHGKVLYVGLEEGFEASMQQNVLRHLDEEAHNGGIEFADHEMTYDELVKKLKRKRSPRFTVIDSVQYWDINYTQYKALKEMFPRKAFIFLSHATGKMPDGRVADKIRYDATIKVHVDKYVAYVVSRLGGNKPYLVWEEGALKHHGRAGLNRILKGIAPAKRTKKK